MARMGRPPKEDSRYRVSIHKANGYRYASTQPPVDIAEDGSKKYKHIHWGSLDENNRFIPGKAFMMISAEERKKLIFPTEWDTTAIKQVEEGKQPLRIVYDTADNNRLYGDIWLLEQISRRLGIYEDLMRVFNENEEMVNDILTLAFFPIITEYSYRRLPRWQKTTKTPTCYELNSSCITRLTQSITETHRKEFLECRASRLNKKELLAVDSTSRSAWGEKLADIRWGKNKDRLPLPQTKEVVAYSLSSHIPVYYRTFPGNMPDSRSLPIILTDMDHMGVKDVTFITDRGYESAKNLETYILRGLSFITCSEVNREYIFEKINAFGEFSTRPDNMDVDPELQIYSVQYDYKYDVIRNGAVVKEGNLKINLYLDPLRRSSEHVFLDSEIKLQEAELKTYISEKTSCENIKELRKNLNYYKLEYDSSTQQITSYTLNEKKVAKIRKLSGFFAIITYGLDLDASETYRHYRLRDEQEKYFQQMKSQLHFDKQQTGSEEGKTGRLFIVFLSLIMTSYIRYMWRSTRLKHLFESSLDILDEMRSIRYIEHKNKKTVITPFVGAQVDICNVFEFAIPADCKPDHVSKRKPVKRRGRPFKSLDNRPV